MAIPDLVTLADTQVALAQSLPDDQTWLPSAISAASRALQRYLRRVVPQTDYIEIRTPAQGQWDKAESDTIVLSNFPVLTSTLNPTVMLRSGRTPALRITNTASTTNQQAYFYLNTVGDPELSLQTNVGVTLVTVASGVTAKSSFPFLGTPTSAGFSVAASGAGGSLTAGTYLCSYTLVNAAGESVRSADVSVTITSGQNLVFTLPALPAQAASMNVYVSTAGGATTTATKQNTAAITGTAFTVGALVSGATYPTTATGTVTQLAAAINALGSGWSATVQGSYGGWATNDLWGSEGTMSALGGTSQGLDCFPNMLTNFRVRWQTGEIALPQGVTAFGGGPGNAWQWPGSSDVAYGSSAWRDPVLCQYAAGWATVPLDLQEATFLTIKANLQSLQTVSRYEEEDTEAVKLKLATIERMAIPQEARRLAAPYRVHRV